jgi:quinol monooxygenase YgiN
VLLLLGGALIASLASQPTYAQAVPTQYVVVYGELSPRPNTLRQAQPLLDYLAELAKGANGSIYFSVNTEIERPNFFSLVEIWQDATTYAAFTGNASTQKVLQHLKPLLIAPLDERDGNLVP